MNEIAWKKEIYPKRIIEHTASVFNELCKIEIRETDSSVICHFRTIIKISEEQMIKEFENYMIDYINSEKLYGDS